MSASFQILTLGCKVNAYESECYYQALLEKGFVPAQDIADIYIINTCAVTNTAAQKSRQKIHQAKKKNPNALICVVGCLVQTQKDTEKENADVLIGARHKDRLADLVYQAYTQKVRLDMRSDVSEAFSYEEMDLSHFEDMTRAYLKVQDGCNQFCSYCTIPLARGRERSLDLFKAVEKAKTLVQAGHKEIVLTGIHTGRYRDADGNDLYDLLTALLNTDVSRIRISSIEVTEVTDEIISLMQKEERLARHLHIPLQSGSDNVLKDMNRPYSATEYIEKLQEIRKRIPDIAFGSDVIVGFPSESEKDYLQTKDTLSKAGVNYLHVFPFSLRKNTKAEEIRNTVSDAVKKERTADLIEFGKKRKEEYLNGFVQKQSLVL